MGSGGGFIDNTLGTNIFGANSADKALDAQSGATGAANDTQRYIFNTQRDDSKPWREAGLKALSGIEDNKFMDNFSGDPGYQFRMGEGMKAINNGASARGMGNSGATMKALLKYGQDYSSNEYNNAYNRNFGRLSTLAGFGQNANQQMAGAAQNYGNNVSANQIGLGNAQGAAHIAQANRQSQMLAQGAGMAAMAFSDERLKTNIEEITQADILEMKKHLRAYAFNYVSDEYGQGDWVGVLAQDLEKSKLGRTLVIENDKGEKMIDLRKVLSMFLATMTEAA